MLILFEQFMSSTRGSNKLVHSTPSRQDKMLAINVSANYRYSSICEGYEPCEQFTKCLITHSHYMIMTWLSYGEVEAMGEELHAKKNAKPLTTVQDCRSRDISCHVCVNPRRANTRSFPHPNQVFVHKPNQSIDEALSRDKTDYWTWNVMAYCQHWFWRLERHNVQIIVIFKNKRLIFWW